MNYAKILKCDLANGTGWCVSLFVTGCSSHCTGCFNQELWNPLVRESIHFRDQTKYMERVEITIYKSFSLLGGSPLFPSKYSDVLSLCKENKQRFPTKKIWIWSRFDYLNIQANNSEILKYIDVLVSGPFIENPKDLTLIWRGSRNQETHFLN